MNLNLGLLLACFGLVVEALDFNDITQAREMSCGVGSNPTMNHGANPVCTCKRNVKGQLCSECKKNSFDMRTDHPDGCLRCFCSGRGGGCSSAQLYQQQIKLGDEDFQLSAYPMANSSDYNEPVYWKLSLRKNLLDTSSYGGVFAFHYNSTEDDLQTQWMREPAVIIQGNGIRLFLRHPLSMITHGAGWYSVNLWEQYWLRDKKSKCKMVQKGKCKCPCCSKSKRKRAKRKDLLKALLKTEEIYIKALLNSDFMVQRPDEIWITKGSSQSTDGSPISQVEQCDCAPGYEGLSCQMCAKGYKKVAYSKHWSGFKCIACQCNGNSNICDPETGHCLMCQNDSTGDFCEKKVLRCNKAGTISDNGVLLKTEERCLCKSRVSGVLCDQCRRGSFDLSEENQHGCTKCWCSEVTHQCTSSNLTRQTIPIYASFMNLQDVQSFERAIATSDGQAVYKVRNGIGALRWLLPKRATGNLLQSYGGYLKFVIENVGDCPDTRFEPFVKLESHSGKSINWIFEPQINLNITQTFTISLTEDSFQYLSLAISRNFFLEILSSVKNIYIYTPRCSEMVSIGIRGISLDSALDFGSPGPLATAVEQCQCPNGYSGLSCENCSRGFSRDASHRCSRKIY